MPVFSEKNPSNDDPSMCPLCLQPIMLVKAFFLSELVEAYLKERQRTKTLTGKSLTEYRHDLLTFVEILGDIPVQALDFDLARNYKDTLLQLPANRRKSPQYRNLGIADLLAMETEPAAMATILRNLARVSAMLKWGIVNGYLATNHLEGVAKSLGKRKQAQWEERSRFSQIELQRIFSSSLSIQTYGRKLQHAAPFYWIPILALFTGARLNELAQLHCNDIVTDSDVVVIDINDNTPDKRLKNDSSRRMVPISDRLLELGFMRYVDKVRLQHDRIFPTLPLGRDGYGRYVSKWFNEVYLPSLDVKTPTNAFHSLRHSVADTLKQSGISYEHAAEYLGHAQATETFGRYGKRYKPAILKAECCERLKFEFIYWQNLMIDI